MIKKIITASVLMATVLINVPALAHAEVSVPPNDTTELVTENPGVPPTDVTDLSGSQSNDQGQEETSTPPADVTDLSTAQPSTPTNPNQGGGSSAPVTPGSQTAVSGTSGFTSGSSLPTTQAVLGATTGPVTGPTCQAVLTQYMRLGQANSATEVAKLQVILNAFMGKKLAITGIFDTATDSALREFQQIHSAEILSPWVNAGLMEKEIPTGYAYITTLWYINNRLCGGNTFPMPTLR